MSTELDDYKTPDGYGTTIGKCLTFAEIEGLLAAERERCAAVAETIDGAYRQAAEAAGCSLDGYFKARASLTEQIAAAIRNLPPQTEGGQS